MKHRFRLKIIAASMLAFFSSNSLATVDIYRWCQSHVDKVREYSQFSPEKLSDLRRLISNATTPEELELVSNIPYDFVFNSIKTHNGYSDEKAKKEALNLIKHLEISPINTAIRLNGMKHESVWTTLYSQCVKNNEESLSDFGG
ncbi:hypothetical protein [Salinivibrio kushneri]|uniref:hypothetical protein n=1 Tax=Salinivibrio kushneri TaxID=1908198 RepID=UPI0022B31FCC|nr:hypothetical protein [Salinivibrio kushneri]WBA11814.1 hypothetical protein O4546_00820 [Salinivibrio kushneri]